MRACIARVFSDIASRPVPSLRSRIWRTTGHFEGQANILSISLHFGAADNPGLKKNGPLSSAALAPVGARICNPPADSLRDRHFAQPPTPATHDPPWPA